MKRILILLILSLSINSFSQRLYKVTAKNGLSIRTKPSINGNRIGKLNLNETVRIIETTDFSLIYENIKGYWVQIETNDYKKGYVFNGFLKPFPKIEIKYNLNRNKEYLTQELIALVNEKKFTIISFEDKECFEIVEIQDYNNDGYEEVLLEQNACGGNGIGNSLIVFSFNGREFVNSDYIGNYYGEKRLNFDKNNIRIFVVDYENIGAGNTTLCKDKKETYIYENFNFKLINSESQNKLNALMELKSEDFIPKPSSELSIKYDLDNNGIIDKITSQYWERWGMLTNCEIILNNEIIESGVIGTPKRIGILKSKTNGVNDLVIECDKVLKWNGQKYIEK